MGRDMSLGTFGDVRLQKGGSFCMNGWLAGVVGGFRYVALAALALGRCGSRAFCITAG